MKRDIGNELLAVYVADCCLALVASNTRGQNISTMKLARIYTKYSLDAYRKHCTHLSFFIIHGMCGMSEKTVALCLGVAKRE